MAYQSKHTGTAIDAGIDINDIQNTRLTTLENKVSSLDNIYLNKTKNDTMRGTLTIHTGLDWNQIKLNDSTDNYHFIHVGTLDGRSEWHFTNNFANDGTRDLLIFRSWEDRLPHDDNLYLNINGTGYKIFGEHHHPTPLECGFNSSGGSAPYFAVRAWANIEVSGSTAVLKNGGNIASVTRSSTGIFQINFSTSMPHANYAVAGSAEAMGAGQEIIGIYSYKTTGFTFDMTNYAGTLTDPTVFSFIVVC